MSYRTHKRLWKTKDENEKKWVKKVATLTFSKRCEAFWCESISMLRSWYMSCHVTLSLVWIGTSFALGNIRSIILALNDNLKKFND
jgi:hypothetical protein